jgi:hypothetical protein
LSLAQLKNLKASVGSDVLGRAKVELLLQLLQPKILDFSSLLEILDEKNEFSVIWVVGIWVRK